jgi:hypothetical protein
MIENLPPANGARTAMRGRFRGADFLKVPASSVRMVIRCLSWLRFVASMQRTHENERHEAMTLPFTVILSGDRVKQS